jgi:predicted phage terminase large subunit-like protein
VSEQHPWARPEAPTPEDLDASEAFKHVASPSVSLSDFGWGPRLDRAIVAKGGLIEFVELAWPQIESVPLVLEPHILEMCKHYEAVSAGDLRELVVNVPPGTGKSTITNVLWPAWDWIRNGARKWIFTSYSQALTARDAQRCGNLVNGEWYQARWGYLADQKELAAEGLKPLAAVGRTRQRGAKSNIAASHYFTTQGGMRYSTMFGGAVTGQHCHFLVADDPIKPQEIQSGGDQAAENLDKVVWRWENVFGNRMADPATFARVCIMQRLHEADLAGHMVEGGACHLRLPIYYDDAKPCVTPFGGDWRTCHGELLAPKRYPASAVQRLKGTEYNADGSTKKRGMTEGDFQAQYMQDPHPEKGSIFKAEWMKRFWDILPAGLEMVISVDAAFKDADDSDYCSAQVWGRQGPDFYLIDHIYAQLDVLGVCDAIITLRRRWPAARAVLVEDKANGSAVIQVLRRSCSGLFEVDPRGGKIARARAVSVYWKAGNVILPRLAPWLPDFMTEHKRFPKARRDDQVDAGTQALLYLEGDNASEMIRAMQNVRAVYQT